MMNIIKNFTITTTFDELNHGEFFSYGNNKNVIYLKVYDTVNSKDLAIVIDDPYGETDGAYCAYQFPKDMVINQVYSADLTLYD